MPRYRVELETFRPETDADQPVWEGEAYGPWHAEMIARDQHDPEGPALFLVFAIEIPEKKEV